MRGMNAAYHHRFFSDIRYTTLDSLALITVGFVFDPRSPVEKENGGSKEHWNLPSP